MGVGSYPFLILIVKATQKNNQKVKKDDKKCWQATLKGV